MPAQAVEASIGRQLTELKVSDKKVAEHVTEVLVAKREAEIRLDREHFGERREINKRKQMILEGMTPDEVDKAMTRMKERREKVSKQRVEQVEKKIEKKASKRTVATIERTQRLNKQKAKDAKATKRTK